MASLPALALQTPPRAKIESELVKALRGLIYRAGLPPKITQELESASRAATHDKNFRDAGTLLIGARNSLAAEFLSARGKAEIDFILGKFDECIALVSLLRKEEMDALLDRPRITGRQDVGPMNGPLNHYLKLRGVPPSLEPELAAKIDRLVKAEIAGREPAPAPPSFAAKLEAMPPKERRAALIEHYGLVPDKDGNYALPLEKQWKPAKSSHDARSPDDMRDWLDKTFPDRREIGFALSDLRHLDARAYKKIFNWSRAKLRPKSGVSKGEIEALGVPSKSMKYDPVRDANAPKSLNEVVARVERGESSFRNLKRAFERSRYHANGP